MRYSAALLFVSLFSRGHSVEVLSFFYLIIMNYLPFLLLVEFMYPGMTMEYGV